MSTNRATQTLSAVYTMWGFIHSPLLSLFRVHWRELMSHTSCSRQLICTKRSNCIASSLFNFLFETLPVFRPLPQIPPFEPSHSAPCRRLNSEHLSPWSLSQTLLHHGYLWQTVQHWLYCPFWVQYVCLPVFILTETVHLSVSSH